MSIIKQKKQRVAIFIDAQNLYHSARAAYGSNVNFKNILEDSLAGRELVRAIAYVITTESGEEKSFFEALKKAGIETKSKDLQIFLGGAKKGDWDVGMTVDAIRLASKVDAVVIISGDGDFIPLVEYLKFNAGCQVEAATFKASASAGLVEVVDDFFDLSKDLDRYLMRNHRSFRNKHFKKRENHKKNFYSIPEIEKGEEKLEMETPEMIAERVSGKRGIISNNNLSRTKNRPESKKKATEVEITRVKKEDFIELENKKKEEKEDNKKNKKNVKKTGVKVSSKKEKEEKKKKIDKKKTTVKKKKATKDKKEISKKETDIKKAKEGAIVKKTKIKKTAKK